MCSYTLWRFWLQFIFTMIGFAFAVLAFFFAKTAGERTAAVGYGFALLFVWFNPPDYQPAKRVKKKKRKKQRRRHSVGTVDPEDVEKLLNGLV